MEFQFFRPFDEIAGASAIRFKISDPTPLKDLLRTLVKEIPSFKPYVKKGGDEVQNFFMVLVRGGEILKLEDRVGDGDVIKVLPPISGGA